MTSRRELDAIIDSYIYDIMDRYNINKFKAEEVLSEILKDHHTEKEIIVNLAIQYLR